MQGASHQMGREEFAVILSKTTLFTSALPCIHEALAVLQTDPLHHPSLHTEPGERKSGTKTSKCTPKRERKSSCSDKRRINGRNADGTTKRNYRLGSSWKNGARK